MTEFRIPEHCLMTSQAQVVVVTCNQVCVGKPTAFAVVATIETGWGCSPELC